MEKRFATNAGAVLAMSVLALAHPVLGARRSHSSGQSSPTASILSKSLSVSSWADGAYSISSDGIHGAVLRSMVEADVDSHPLTSSAYPTHRVEKASFRDELGSGSRLTVTHTGLAGKPDLITTIRLYDNERWGDIQVVVRNGTGQPLTVQAIRSVKTDETPAINLNGPASADRVLSDSYSEDRPELQIRDLADAPDHMHRGVGSQLIYNRESNQSLFLGALTSDKLLTIFHLTEGGAAESAHPVSYEAVATGTTEILRGESLKNSPPADQIELSLPLAPNESLASERLMFAVGPDYRAQLDAYGRAIRILHKARVDTPTPIGWWSWTAYYFGLSEGTAITNAEWLSENLKSAGYSYYQIDEGYQYARGEYSTADARLYPRGLAYIGGRVRHYGLRFGVWTSPFEVSERAWVFQNHKDWLVHNLAGQPLPIGHVTGKDDQLYVLDTTNPGAQEYLRQTYRTLKDEWGVRFIKMDFMDDSAVEGQYYRPHTTGLEAQRIGLQIIRDTVGDDVVLDKDGSPMLNPVGIVDAGRISQDTGHSFDATKEAATGIAARYYMNRNFYVADPDAFTVSTQTVDDQSWHGGQRPLTLDEAKASIALSAVSGGMFEIGDDLPTLGASQDRVALVKSTDLVNMARLGRSSTPVDLMSYDPADKQPSIFILKENKRQSILTIFNWTEAERSHEITLASLGMNGRNYVSTDLFSGRPCCSESSSANGGTLKIGQPAHSVRIFKVVDSSIPPEPPGFEVHAPSDAKTGDSLKFSAVAASQDWPVVAYRWDLGDGITIEGASVTHAYTSAGDYQVRVTALGPDGTKQERTVPIHVNGSVSTRFNPAEKERYHSR